MSVPAAVNLGEDIKESLCEPLESQRERGLAFNDRDGERGLAFNNLREVERERGLAFNLASTLISISTSISAI